MRYGLLQQQARRMLRNDIRAIVAHVVAELQDWAEELSQLDEKYALAVAAALETAARQIRAKHRHQKRVRMRHKPYGEEE